MPLDPLSSITSWVLILKKKKEIQIQGPFWANLIAMAFIPLSARVHEFILHRLIFFMYVHGGKEEHCVQQ